MNRLFIVLGLGPSGLFIARQLSKVTNNIVGIGRSDDIGAYSKFVRFYKAETPEALTKILRELCSGQSEKPKLYICSDQYITLILNEYPEIFDITDVDGPDKEILCILNDKIKSFEYCRIKKFNVPLDVPFSQLKNNPSIVYPIILKWSAKHINTQENLIGKTKVINDADELERLSFALQAHSVDTSELIAQRYIKGDNANQFSFGGYFVNGKEYAGIVVNQCRQYPQGISSFVVETTEEISEILRNYACNFAEMLCYTGFLEMEFKQDSQSKDIFLLDINPRPWGWISILGVKFKDFYKIFNREFPTAEQKTVVWKNPVRDVVAKYKNINNIRPTLKGKYLYAYDIFDWKDICPVFALIWVGFKKYYAGR